MNGQQFIAMLGGKLKPDETKITEALEKYAKEFPKAEIEIMPDRLCVRVWARRENDQVLCMVCGNPLIQRAGHYFKNGTWIPKKRKDNLSNYECPSCAPGKSFMPIGAWTETGKIEE